MSGHTGNVLLDLEHQELEAIVELLKVYLNSKFRSRVPLVVIIFNTKLVAHCIHEEEFLRLTADPNIEQHECAHRDLLAKATSLLLKLEKQHDYSSIADDLVEILITHGKEFDKYMLAPNAQ